MMSKCTSCSQNVRRNVKKYGKYVMISKRTSWRQTVRHDITKIRHDVKKYAVTTKSKL